MTTKKPNRLVREIAEMAGAQRRLGIMDEAETIIRALAARQGVEAQRTALDGWAEDVTRLSGDAVALDAVEELIVGLRRGNLVDRIELTRLHSRYLDERAEKSCLHVSV